MKHFKNIIQHFSYAKVLSFDLLLTNIPHKVRSINIFQDIIKTDHKLIEFCLDFKIGKKPNINRKVYNFKKASLYNLKTTVPIISWDIVFDKCSIDNSLQNWKGLFIPIVDQYILKVSIKNNSCPWIDKGVIHALRMKDKLPKTANRTGKRQDINNFITYKILRKSLP